jgi:NADH-quinone oxidoreductase subunit J
LFLFGIMLTRARLGDDESVGRERRWMAALVGVVLFAVMAGALIGDFEDTHVDIASPSTTAQVSDSIFSQYLIPFEVVGMLLLAALIGAIVVARKD